MTSEFSLIQNTVRTIVEQANTLRLKHAAEFEGAVSYCCMFSQSQKQFEHFVTIAKSVGKIATITNTGPVFIVPAVETAAGVLRVFKVRSIDQTRKELGDADFSLTKYSDFKARYLGTEGFKLITRSEFEMIELTDSTFNVRAYFSNPPVEMHSGIREALDAIEGRKHI